MEYFSVYDLIKKVKTTGDISMEEYEKWRKTFLKDLDSEIERRAAKRKQRIYVIRPHAAEWATKFPIVVSASSDFEILKKLNQWCTDAHEADILYEEVLGHIKHHHAGDNLAIARLLVQDYVDSSDARACDFYVDEIGETIVKGKGVAAIAYRRGHLPYLLRMDSEEMVKAELVKLETNCYNMVAGELL